MASTIVIRINGVDVTDDVLFGDAEFNSQVSSSPGLCKFRLKDINYVYSLVTGQTITLDIDGKRMWGGWIQSIGRQYFFPYTGSPLPEKRITGPHGNPCLDVPTVAMVARALVIEGVDHNILFARRFCFDKAKPASSDLKSWPAGTHDDVQIRYLCSHHLALEGDGIDYTTKVEYVGSPNPDARGNPAAAGWQWGEAMRAIGRYPGAIFYIDPERNLVYTDVDTANATHKLRDVPSAPDELGYRDMEILYNGANLINDSMVWGAGQGSKRVKFKRTRDASSVASHGLWQVGDFRGDLWRQASVDKRSNSFVYGSPQNKRGGKDDAISVACTLFKPIFSVAEKVDFRSDVYGYADVLPVRRMKITFPTTEEARFDLILSHAIDEPWNTFEYWFPPIPKPHIVIPVTDDVTNCPVVNYPREFETPIIGYVIGAPGTTGSSSYQSTQTVTLGAFISVFADDFKHPSGTQPPNGCGFWANAQDVNTPPVIVDGKHQLFNGEKVHFYSPVSSDIQVLMALDLSSWANGYGSLQVQGGEGGVLLLDMAANGNIRSANSIDYQRVDYNKMRGLVYVRAVLYKGYYSAVKIWPQSQPEPFEWTATSSPTMTNNYGQTYVNGAFGLYFSGSYMPKLMGISAFGSVEDTPVSVAFDQDTNGWYHSWPFEDPGDGNVYAISWGQYANNNTNGSPSHGGGIAWGYFGPDHGRGVPSSMGYQIQSLAVREPPGWDNVNGDPNFRPYAPSRVKITGKIHVSMGRSQGIDSRDQYPTSHSVTTVITVFNYAPGQPYWLGEPYWKPLGRDVLYQQHNIDADGPASIKPFEFEVYSDYWSSGIDIDSLEDGAFAWGVSMWDPLSKMREMDSRGGPFMLPNVGSFNVSVSEVVYWGVWDTIPCGTHFCMAAAENGGVEDQRTCEGVPIDSIKLHELYTDGQVWSVVLQKPFVPGTVTVTVDGMPAKPALDFIESSPSTGVIMFLNSFLNAKEMTVCYIPDEGGNTETDPITYARPGGAPVPV